MHPALAVNLAIILAAMVIGVALSNPLTVLALAFLQPMQTGIPMEMLQALGGAEDDSQPMGFTAQVG